LTSLVKLTALYLIAEIRVFIYHVKQGIIVLKHWMGCGEIMKKRLVTYRKKIDDLLLQGNCHWEELIAEHLVQISFFQHERLIHLIDFDHDDSDNPG